MWRCGREQCEHGRGFGCPFQVPCDEKQKAAFEFVPRKIILKDWVPDWNLKEAAGLVDSEVRTWIKQAMDLLHLVTSGVDWDAIEHGQVTYERTAMVNLWFLEDLAKWQRIAKDEDFKRALDLKPLSTRGVGARFTIELSDRREPWRMANTQIFSVCRAPVADQKWE